MSLNVENIKKITFDNLENNEVIIAVNEKINKRAKNGYFYLNDEYCESENSPETVLWKPHRLRWGGNKT